MHYHKHDMMHHLLRMKKTLFGLGNTERAYLLMHVHGGTEGKKDAGDHRARVPHKHGEILHVHGHVTLSVTPLTESKAEGGPVDNKAPLFYVNA